MFCALDRDVGAFLVGAKSRQVEYHQPAIDVPRARLHELGLPLQAYFDVSRGRSSQVRHRWAACRRSCGCAKLLNVLRHRIRFLGKRTLQIQSVFSPLPRSAVGIQPCLSRSRDLATDIRDEVQSNVTAQHGGFQNLGLQIQRMRWRATMATVARYVVASKNTE